MPHLCSLRRPCWFEVDADARSNPRGWRSSTSSARRGWLLLAGANPKVLALSVGAVLSLASVHGASSLDAWAIVPFVVIGATSVLVPLGAFYLFPRRVAAVLSALRTWLIEHEHVVLIVVGFAIGGTLIVSSIGGVRN